MNASFLFQYRKDPRIIITVPLVIVTVTSLIYYLVQRAKELSPEALSSRLLLFVLWNINLILILGILFVLLRGIIKLILDRQRGILGSRFRSKLVITYVVTSLLPILLLFFVATDLLRVSIDRWFNTPVRTLLANSERIAQVAEDQSIAGADRAARALAGAIAAGGSLDSSLERVRQAHGADLVGVYQRGAALKLIANLKAPISQVGEPSNRFFEEVASRGFARKIDVVPAGKWIRSARRIGDGSAGLAALGGVFIPGEISRMVDQNIVAWQNFQQLESNRPGLKASQTLLFLAVTLSILFSTLWTSIYVSRRITTPIEALAEGTRTLAEGRFDHRISVRGTDEFATLIQSFNAMSSQIESNREALTRSNEELTTTARRLDQERAWLATVQESVSTGIITFSPRLELLGINRAAQQMLSLPLSSIGSGPRELFHDELSPLRDYLEELPSREPRPREITIVHSGELRYLEVSASRLDEAGGRGGWVVAIEDSTQLVQAQKLAAWSEAARRIAHEIKNPLTPIQLSAERISKKFRAGDVGLAAAVEEGCQTIVNEVAHLKRMVDEFSRFARMPAIHPRQTSIAELLEGVARLYRDSKGGVEVRTESDPSLEALVDPEQIRRALINLLDNALEATDRGVITLAATMSNGSLRISVEDTGRGVSDADKERLFLPQFSTKGRGTGLGLAIVHRIVSDHDGRISVHDNPPRGTKFEIEIPA